jgi:hypothetical protein
MLHPKTSVFQHAALMCDARHKKSPERKEAHSFAIPSNLHGNENIERYFHCISVLCACRHEGPA